MKSLWRWCGLGLVLGVTVAIVSCATRSVEVSASGVSAQQAALTFVEQGVQEPREKIPSRYKQGRRLL